MKFETCHIYFASSKYFQAHMQNGLLDVSGHQLHQFNTSHAWNDSYDHYFTMCQRFFEKKKIFFRDIKNHCGAKIDEIWNMPYIFRKFKIFSSSYAKWFTWCFRAPITSIQHITRLKWFLWPLLHDVPEIFWKKKIFFRDIKNHCGAKIDEIWNMPYIFRKFKIFSSSYAKWFTWCFRAPITSIQHITRLKWFLWPLLHDVPEIFWKKKNFF